MAQERKEYETEIGGLKHTVKLTADEAAKAKGAKPYTRSKGRRPANKAVTPQDKTTGQTSPADQS